MRALRRWHQQPDDPRAQLGVEPATMDRIRFDLLVAGAARLYRPQSDDRVRQASEHQRNERAARRRLCVAPVPDQSTDSATSIFASPTHAAR